MGVQEFREFCDKIHAAHPEIKEFKYFGSKKGIQVYFPIQRINLEVSNFPCPDFGPDDLTYEIKPEYIWKVPDETTPVDAKVWVRDSVSWCRRHFKRIDKGVFCCFPSCASSWTTERKEDMPWEYCILADPKNPERKPDDNWRPE